MSHSMRSRFVNVGGIRTHYTESGGNGPVIVALHGGGAGSSGEAGMAPLMQALPPEYRVVALDSVGGFGLTDPAAPAPYGLQSRVDHLAACADALCLDRFTILGNSQGAWVAARYAITHPDRIERVVLVGSASIAAAMGLPETRTPAMQALFDFDGSREAMRRLLAGLVYDKSKVTEGLVDLRLASCSRPGAMDAYHAATSANRHMMTDPLARSQFDMRQSLPALTQAISTIVIWGEDDAFAPVELGRRLETMLPHAAFHFIAKAGHQVQTDQPEAMAGIVGDFMASRVAMKAEA